MTGLCKRKVKWWCRRESRNPSLPLSLLGYKNGYIFTWILHQIFIYSNKVKLVSGPLLLPLPHPLSSYWMNELTIDEFYARRLNWWQFVPCHNIHVYSTITSITENKRYLCENLEPEFCHHFHVKKFGKKSSMSYNFIRWKLSF